MRKINCRKCGAEIDASLGECPNCGAVYYILPDEDQKLEWAMGMEPEAVQGRTENGAGPEKRAGAFGPEELLKADNDELFNTRVWRINEAEKQPAPADPGVQAFNAPGQANRPASPPPDLRARRAESQNRARRDAGAQGKAGRLRKIRLAVAAVALLAVLTLVLSIMDGLFDFGGDKRDGDGMPGVLGLTVEAATARLEALGLEVVTMEQAAGEPAGTVIGQSVKEGKTVKSGDSVTLTVSSGSEPVSSESVEYAEVPALTGKTYDEAREILAKLGLRIVRAEDAYSNTEAGIVISQSPMKGAKLRKDNLVMVTISKGPEPSPSPAGHTISVTAGKGGSVSPKGAVIVEDGQDQSFTITPDSGYEVAEVKADGQDVGVVTSYTFSGVTGSHTLYVVFRQKIEVSPSPSPSPPVSEADTPPASDGGE
ncbi:MAG: PASTA domain-containing protein [Oscillospiraceae bacterium]|jgi:hypothetical protein|nr:PASTA domain-containing protein [Oscillospiraceae bacterium]